MSAFLRVIELALHAALRRGVPDERLAADPGGHGYATKKWSVLVGVETRR